MAPCNRGSVPAATELIILQAIFTVNVIYVSMQELNQTEILATIFATERETLIYWPTWQLARNKADMRSPVIASFMSPI